MLNATALGREVSQEGKIRGFAPLAWWAVARSICLLGSRKLGLCGKHIENGAYEVSHIYQGDRSCVTACNLMSYVPSPSFCGTMGSNLTNATAVTVLDCH